MKALNCCQAKQHFCWHAFTQSHPAQEFEDLVEKAMNICQGLPLSLEVLGRQLYKKEKEYCVSELEKISRILPEDIRKRLKISFDALNREEKEMFLDTACFFLGEEKYLAIEVWNSSGWSGLNGWEKLLSKCLVELDQQNRIHMHDHLRVMGREIAIEQTPYRLFPSSNLEIWRPAQERMLIRGIMEISTDRSRWWPYIAKPSLDYRPLFKEFLELKPSICGVQLLVAANIEFSEEYATLSKELRWLRLFKFRQSSLPSWLSLENLRVLEIYEADHLKELWQDNLQKPPLQLRELIIHLRCENPSFQRFPRSLGRLRHLKKLSCIGGRYVQNLPKGFCNLQSLEHLELQHLAGLSSLPSRFGDLTNLTHINLAECHQLKMLPDSFKQLKHLQYLNLQGCSNLTFTEHNADILENITKLEYLSFYGCKELQVLPHHITKQAFLRELDLEGTSLSELPSSIDQLQRLEVLRIGSAQLKSLPDSLGNLSSLICLRIESCEKVRSLPESLGCLALLTSIYVCSTGVKSLPQTFGHLVSLQTLSITDLPIRELFFEFEESSSLPRLKTIFLGYTSISTMSIPQDFCPSLETLDLSHNEFLEEIKALPRTVKTITLVDCEELKDIAGIGSLRNLQRLIIEQCPKLAELPSFAEFASMKEIKIRECQISGRMEGLEQLTSLETLEVHTQWEVPGITSLEHAEGLRRLQLLAHNIGALEPCIKTLQKWPGEVMMCARVLGGVESIVKAFTSSNLMVVEACAEETERNDESDEVGCRSIYARALSCVESLVKAFTSSNLTVVDEACRNDQSEEDEGSEERQTSDEGEEDGWILKYRKTNWSYQSYVSGKWSLGYPKTCLSHEATIVCFVMNCPSQEGWARAWATPQRVEKKENLCTLKLDEGKWVWIHIASQGSCHVESDLEIHLNSGSTVEKGLLATGEERGVKHIFYQVLDALQM